MSLECYAGNWIIKKGCKHSTSAASSHKAALPFTRWTFVLGGRCVQQTNNGFHSGLQTSYFRGGSKSLQLVLSPSNK